MKQRLSGLGGAALLALAMGCAPGDDVQATPALDVTSYDLRGHFDWDADRLIAEVTIAGTWNPSEEGRLTFGSDVMEVTSVRDRSGAHLAFEVDAGAKLLHIDPEGLSGSGTFEVTIDYEATSGDALRAVPPLVGDPVPIRALFTDSEPSMAIQWMPSHDDPSDRALFSVEMDMARAERMIATGTLVREEASGEERHMRYESAQPIPTYVMAFAISEFEVLEHTRNGVPLSLWRRKGVIGDPKGTLQAVERFFDVIEPLAGPYPFPSYAVVFLPDFPSAMENAGASFFGETLGLEPSLGTDIAILAHETAHQWFGDYVTVATWDDLWLKEGLATLFEWEARRADEDFTGSGLLGGDSRWLFGEYPIRDTSLALEDKHNPGPYTRAAWWWAQMRSVVGEQMFWETLRHLLRAHAWGHLSTGDVLSAFQPLVDPDTFRRAVAAIDARALPYFDVETNGTDTFPPTQATFTLRDPGGTLVAPWEVDVYRERGGVQRLTLDKDVPFTFSRNDPGDFIVADPSDVHPNTWPLMGFEGCSIPLSTSGTHSFLELPGPHQLASLSFGYLPAVPASNLADLRAKLNGESAKAAWLFAACEQDPEWQSNLLGTPEEIAEGLRETAQATPAWRGLPWAPRYDMCRNVFSDPGPFAYALQQLAIGVPQPAVPYRDLLYLGRFFHSAEQERTFWLATLANGYSGRARALAAQRIRRDLASLIDYFAGDPSLVNPFMHFLRTVEVSSQLTPLLNATPEVADVVPERVPEMRDAIKGVLEKKVTRVSHAAAICAAYKITSPDGSWPAWSASLDARFLSAEARALLANPEGC